VTPVADGLAADVAEEAGHVFEEIEFAVAEDGRVTERTESPRGRRAWSTASRWRLRR